ncbi:SLC13 family permease [Azospirillum argentinense]|uniref:RCK C-terminal domain-containing protein n=1 Tax=Azospirillum argentinense TaxID=2970906 RepID=A0A5B0KP85_9PROT|nr:SLC13 family permease [Azospirillum argentinense]KAA1053755.1 Transporter, sodium/sulfate symporter family [Azospirillum argentinense]
MARNGSNTWRPPLTLDQTLAVTILIGLVTLFVWNRLRYDLAALLGLLMAMACGVVPPDRAFVGFGDPVVVIVASALVVSAGVGKSGVIGRAVRSLEPRMRTTGMQVAVLTGSVAVLSAFMKNIGALAIFLPIAIQVARRSGTPASKLLMPMAFGSLIGGLVTLIGTSPNILVSRVRAELTGTPFGMFDFAPVGLGIVVVGFAFLVVGWRLLPGGRQGVKPAAAAFDVEPYLSEVRLPATSPLVGKTVADLEALGEGGVTVIAIIREAERRYVPAGHWTLFADDILVLQSDPHALKAIMSDAGLRLEEAGKGLVKGQPASDVGVVEAVVTTNSPLIACSPAELGLRQRHGVNLLGISRHGDRIVTRLRNLRFQAGDVLVLAGSAEAMPETLRGLGCLPLVDRATGLERRRQEYLPIMLLVLAMGAVALDLMPVPAAFFGAAVLIVLFGVLTLQEAYQAIELPILVLLACLIPISDAIGRTGTADLVAEGLAAIAVTLPPTGVVTLVMVTAMILTPFLNNAATALIMAPIAASLAQRLGMNADPLLMAVAVGAACDFLTPIGHQCNTLVMGPGGYRFGDYWRLGLPLSVIIVVVGSVLIPLVWRLR